MHLFLGFTHRNLTFNFSRELKKNVDTSFVIFLSVIIPNMTWPSGAHTNHFLIIFHHYLNKTTKPLYKYWLASNTTHKWICYVVRGQHAFNSIKFKRLQKYYTILWLLLLNYWIKRIFSSLRLCCHKNGTSGGNIRKITHETYYC